MKLLFKTPDGKIVVVVVNEGNSRNVKFSLDHYSNVSVYTTNSELKCSNTYSGALKDKYEITANSINTFVFLNNRRNYKEKYKKI
ncbi:MAG: hypothetical protein L6V88_03370 [Anaerotruncus sp.]|nr:MAG: hypothetical protein L6V88_03370 [Anaerotruncus sp.]